MLSAFPQWQASRLAWSRLIHPCPVLVTITDAGMYFCWREGRRWRFRSALWPEGACRDGSPSNREAIGELIADLLFDLQLPGAELVLCLPPSAAHWCVVDGLSAADITSEGLRRDSLGSVDLPFNLEQSYLLTTPIQDTLAVAGIARSSVQAWIDVVEIADLPLRRISWSLIDAQRALTQITKEWNGDLAWLLVHDGKARLLLMRDRTPEIDHTLSSVDVDLCVAEARACVQAWQQRKYASCPLGWWLTLDDARECDWHHLVDQGAGEQLLNTSLPWTPDPWPEADEMSVLPSLAHLALTVLHEEESW